MKKTVRWLQVSAAVLFVVLLIAALVINRMWQDRADIADIGWPQADTTANPDARVFVTWLGITTLLFDDGETQILIDGTITRVSALDLIFSLPISSDVAAINYALSTFRVNRLAAIIPVHSHFDHAIDLGHIANRTTAVVLGSESTANIARGAGVPVDQYQTLDNGESRQFGEFTIRLVASVHAPVGLNGEEWFPGRISLPLRQPENPSAWKTGVAWSIFIEHPRGTSLIQGSAGFVAGSMVDESADVVMLGVGGLAGLDAEYASDYWNEIVVATGASRVLSVHHDDYTAPFGEIRLFPNIADNVLQAAKWLDDANSAGEKEVVIELPPFGQMIPLY